MFFRPIAEELKKNCDDIGCESGLFAAKNENKIACQLSSLSYKKRRIQRVHRNMKILKYCLN